MTGAEAGLNALKVIYKGLIFRTKFHKFPTEVQTLQGKRMPVKSLAVGNVQ